MTAGRSGECAQQTAAAPPEKRKVMSSGYVAVKVSHGYGGRSPRERLPMVVIETFEGAMDASDFMKMKKDRQRVVDVIEQKDNDKLKIAIFFTTQQFARQFAELLNSNLNTISIYSSDLGRSNSNETIPS
jgi:hypothetical protein